MEHYETVDIKLACQSMSLKFTIMVRIYGFVSNICVIIAIIWECMVAFEYHGKGLLIGQAGSNQLLWTKFATFSELFSLLK